MLIKVLLSVHSKLPCVICCVCPGAVAGGLFAAPQQYMQQRVSWFKTNMTGGTMSALFNIDNHYGKQDPISIQDNRPSRLYAGPRQEAWVLRCASGNAD